MKNINKLFFASILVILTFFSCEKNKPITEEDMGYPYFPDDVGKWIIYDVTYREIDDTMGIDTTYYYQIKEIIESKFIDDENREAMRIERYIKYYNDTITDNDTIPFDSVPWTIKDVWYANLTQNTAEKVEENVRYLKLKFPIRDGFSWNGNIFNTNEPWDYTYKDIHQAKTINGILFDSTITVQQRDILNLVQNEYAVEIYAKNIGLVYKECDTLTTYVNGEINKGSELKMKIVSYSQ